LQRGGIMEKCEWKDRELWQCDKRPFPDNIPLTEWDYCPFCGADIRKPEEKPLIVASGGTWVARWKDVDYLCIAQKSVYESEDIFNLGYNPIHLHPHLWKPFSAIELTDEIAKLRPMVIDCKIIEKLYAIENDTAITDQYKDPVSNYRLATAKELEARQC